MNYAGIGSREVPKMYQDIMIKLGEWLANKNWTLRSGGADGSDTYFEIGANKVNGKKEIFLPWPGFNGSKSNLVVNNPKCFEFAKEYHPAFDRLSQGAQKLQARNTHQVLGWDLNTPSKFVVCYTKDGSGSGGTGQAIRIAKKYNIPVFDLGNYKSIEHARRDFITFYNMIIVNPNTKVNEEGVIYEFRM